MTHMKHKGQTEDQVTFHTTLEVKNHQIRLDGSIWVDLQGLVTVVISPIGFLMKNGTLETNQIGSLMSTVVYPSVQVRLKDRLDKEYY